jgi:D-aminopeptidase
MFYILQLLLIFTGYIAMTSPLYGTERPRARDVGIHVGVFRPGTHNAITDVDGVKVGHRTIIEGNDIRTGVTAIFPHRGNIFLEKVPAAIELGNAFGKLTGYPQVEELGELETPIILTNTLSTWTAASALVEYMLRLRGNEHVRSVNPVVGETNDGHLNDIRKMYITSDHVFDALESASAGPVEEGAVGAGTGTTAFGWKGGIGTASRVLPDRYGRYTIGVLVQTNFGGILTIDGVPVGRELGEHMFRDTTNQGEGSVIIVVATDAPLTATHLKRLAKRALIGLGRTGSMMAHGSGDFVIAFSTSEKVRISNLKRREFEETILRHSDLTVIFQAVVEATEEAIYNSLLKANTTTGFMGNTVEAIPVERVKGIMKSYGR